MLKKLLISTALLLAFSSQAQAEKQVVLQVKEMTCQLCAYLVNKELRDVDGVLATKANIKTNLVKITAEDNVQTALLIKAVEKLHYTAVVAE